MSAPPIGQLTTAHVQKIVHDIAVAVLERDVDPSADLFDQGTPSIAFVRIVAEIGVQFEVELDIAELEDASIVQLAQLVTHQLAAARPTEKDT